LRSVVSSLLIKFKPDVPLNLARQPEPKEHVNFATAARLLSCLVSESLVHAIPLALNLAPKAEPKEHANFATAARLLSCLVSESLVHAIYRPLHRTNLNVAGFATIFKGGVSLENSAFEADNILAVVPLHHAPIFKHDADYRHGHQIGLLNPLDMMFTVYETKNTQNGIDDRYPIDVCSFLLDFKGCDSHRTLGQCYSCYFGISCRNCTRVGSEPNIQIYRCVIHLGEDRVEFKAWRFCSTRYQTWSV
jgi:hypothetical protein